MSAVALTDHGVMFGAIEFYKKATTRPGSSRSSGWKLHRDHGSRLREGEVRRPESARGRGRDVYHHLVLLAKDQTGYRNLIKLCTLGHTRGFLLQAPDRSWKCSGEHSDGLVALSACAGGSRLGPPRGREYTTRPVAIAGIYKEIFGDDFYIEIQNHGIEKERLDPGGDARGWRGSGLKLICTNDVHYIKHEHAIAHNIMLLIPDASSPNTPDYHSAPVSDRPGHTSSRRRRCCELFKRLPRGDCLDAGGRGEVQSEDSTSRPNHHAAVPDPGRCGASTLEAVPRGARRDGICAKRYPRPRARRRGPGWSIELGVINEDGVRRVFPDRPGFHPRGARAGGHGRTGTRERRREHRFVRSRHHQRRPAEIRPAVRAVPEPGPRQHARHRHGLLGHQARRGDPSTSGRSTATIRSRRSSRSARSRRGPS